MFKLIDHSTVKKQYPEKDTPIITRFFVIADDLPIDHLALQYALLATGKGVSVDNYGLFRVVSDSSASGFSEPECDVLSVPDTFEEYLELLGDLTKSSAAAATVVDKHHMLISHLEDPLQPNAFLAETDGSATDDDITDMVNRAYVLYSLLRRDTPPQQCDTVNTHGIHFGVTRSGHSIYYHARLDHLKKSAFAKAFFKYAQANDITVFAEIYSKGYCYFVTGNSVGDMADDDTCFYSLSYLNLESENGCAFLSVRDYENFTNVIISLRQGGETMEDLLEKISCFCS